MVHARSWRKGGPQTLRVGVVAVEGYAYYGGTGVEFFLAMQAAERPAWALAPGGSVTLAVSVQGIDTTGVFAVTGFDNEGGRTRVIVAGELPFVAQAENDGMGFALRVTGGSFAGDALDTVDGSLKPAASVRWVVVPSEAGGTLSVS